MNFDAIDLSGADEAWQPGEAARPPRTGAAGGGLFAWYEPGYSDGLGDRLRLFDNTDGPPLELLRVRPELAEVPHFEFSLRERAFELAHFENRHHARVCRLDRLPDPGGGLAIVCERAEGQRLAEVLRAAERRSLRPGPDVTVALVADLLAALAAFHGRGRHLNHGALNPDRIVVAPGGRIVLTEYVFGSALRRLPYDRERLWRDFGFAVPADPAAAAFDQRTDVLQAGLVALALTLGRRLTPRDYPSRLTELMREARERSSAACFEWLERALGTGASEAFGDGVDARRAFTAVAGADHERSLRTAFWPALLAASEDGDWMSPASAVPGPRASLPVSTADRGAEVLALRSSLDPPFAAAGTATAAALGKAAGGVGSPWPESLDVVTGDGDEFVGPASAPSFAGPSAGGEVGQRPALVAPHAREVQEREVRREEAREFAREAPAAPTPKLRRWQIAALFALAVVASAEALYIVSHGAPWARPVAPSGGRLTIGSEPPEAAVTLDGKPAGRTPVTLDVAAGSHVVELTAGPRRRRLALSVEDGSTASHFVELPPAVPGAGRLQVTTEPPAVEVKVDGEPRGTTPLVVSDLAPGPHEVVLSRGSRTIRQTVGIESGATATLFVPIPAASEVSAGWATIRSAVELHVFERGELIGVSRSGRIMLPAGRHDVEVVNEALGFRATREIRVPAGGTAVVDVDMPLTTIDLNATPWAEVSIDGRTIGETPLGGVRVAIGPHEVTFTHPQLGERKISCVVSLQRPTRLSVDLTR